jgi:cyanophycinase
MLSQLPRVSAVVLLVIASGMGQVSFKYIRVGENADVQTKPFAGIALMGGGSDLDEAFRWLCQKANGGDFLVLRASGGDDYNAYVKGLCKLNSVATLIVPDRAASLDPFVVNAINRAEAIFIAGGDQAQYVNYWKTTPVQDAINDAVAAGKPIGGTSAGLAIAGAFSYGALNDPPDGSDLASQDALQDPYLARITLVRDFLNIPLLKNTLTDSHFVKRDRMGRSLVFLARIVQEGWSSDAHEIAIDEGSAALIEPDGKATIVGPGTGAYFMRLSPAPELCEHGEPLTLRNVAVYKAPAGAHFNLSSWTGDGGLSYTLSVERGTIRSSRQDGSIY